MGESTIHMVLVERMAEWVVNELLDGNSSVVLLDKHSLTANSRPPMIDGHIPDLYVDEKVSKLLIIGEAKSSKDLDSERSEKQIEAFLKYCALHKKATFVLAVPWYKTRFARCLLQMLQERAKAEGVTTQVIEKLPG